MSENSAEFFKQSFDLTNLCIQTDTHILWYLVGWRKILKLKVPVDLVERPWPWTPGPLMWQAK